MTIDVLARAVPGVLLVRRLPVHVDATELLHPGRHERLDPGGKRPERGAEVVGVPVAGHVGLSEPDEPVAPHPVEERVAMDAHHRIVAVTRTRDAPVRELHAHGQPAGDAHEEGAADRRVHPLARRGRQRPPRAGPVVAVLEGLGRDRHHTPSCRTCGGRGTRGTRRSQSSTPWMRILAVTHQLGSG